MDDLTPDEVFERLRAAKRRAKEERRWKRRVEKDRRSLGEPIGFLVDRTPAKKK